MNTSELKSRTKAFSISIIGLVEQLPATIACRVVANQIIRAGTSVGANYRAVCRSRSDREFIAKMEIVLEEADETLFWLELIHDKGWISKPIIDELWTEGNELTSIFVASLKTVKAKLHK
ncbi:MAG: four helix bundle protein [Flavobacterium sp.]|nr:four helix bundle protein [Flavobacterium sp.]